MKPKVIGIGELLWDLLPTGPRMGGAPVNFASHAKALGADATVISRVGADEPGARLIGELRTLGVATDGITVDALNPTGTVVVSLDSAGQPQFKIVGGVAWDHLHATPETLRRAGSADVICFGSLCQRSASSQAAIHQLVEASSSSALRVFDVNLREDFFSAEILDASLKLANICKLSDCELPVVARMLGLKGGVRGQLHQLVARYGLCLIVYTRGAMGSVLCDGVEWCEHPGFTTKVRDTVGAGDSFAAAVSMGLLQGWSLETISNRANEIAAFVCSRDGAVPELPSIFRDQFHWDGWEWPAKEPERLVLTQPMAD